MAMVSWMLQQPVALTWAMKVKKKPKKTQAAVEKALKKCDSWSVSRRPARERRNWTPPEGGTVHNSWRLRDDERRWEKEWWLTAWASWLPVSCTSVGLCLHFLGLGVRSLRPPWHSCASMPPPPLPSCPALILLLEGMFSLLRSAVAEVALQSQGKRWGSERPASHLAVRAAPSLSAPHWRKRFLERGRWGHPLHYFFFYLSPAANELFTFCANSIYYLLSTLHIDIFCCLWANAIL